MPIVKKYSYPFTYRGNIVLFILFLFTFPPVALILAVKNLGLNFNDITLTLEYRGSMGWLLFWSVLFFPFAIILILLKGVDLVEEHY